MMIVTMNLLMNLFRSEYAMFCQRILSGRIDGSGAGQLPPIYLFLSLAYLVEQQH